MKPQRITADLLKKKGACSKGIKDFEEAYPSGVNYTVKRHQDMLQNNELAGFESWLVYNGVIPPLCVSTGDHGTATAGYNGTATAGYKGTATAGDYGTATAGNFGTATAGNFGTATAGHNGTAAAGDRGTLHIKYWCKTSGHFKTATAYTSDPGILPNTKYKLDKQHNFVLA